MEVIDTICEKLNLSELEKVQILKDISVKIKVKPAYIGLAVLSVLVVIAIIGYGGKWLSFVVGFLYPAYMSFKAIESKGDTDDDKQCLTYWVVFSFFHVFDSIVSLILSIIPFYSVLKVGFYVWLAHPKTKGALVIYNKVVKLILKKYEAVIDQNIQKVQEKIEEAQPMLNKVGKNLQKEAINRAIDGNK